MAPTTDEVREAFNDVSTAETETSDLANGIRVTVHDGDAGLLFQRIRERGFNANTSRIGDTLVSHIEAEKTDGLGDLFG